MKIQLTIFLAASLLFLNGFLKAQENKKPMDTAAYLKKFEMNKDKYIGKPFSLLLKYMFDMQPKKAKSTFNDDIKNPMTGTTFGFSDKDINADNQAVLLVKWKADDLPTIPIEFAEQESNYRFTAGEKILLEKKIVKDIAVIIKQ